MKSLEITSGYAPATASRLLRRMHDLSPEQQTVGAIVVVIHAFGLRPRELLAMNVADVTLDDEIARVRCRGSVRLGEIKRLYLATYLHEIRSMRVRDPKETALWLNCRGRRMSLRSLQLLLRENLPLMDGKRLSFDNLSHGFIMLFVDDWGGRDIISEPTFNLTPYIRLTAADLKKSHVRCRPNRPDAIRPKLRRRKKGLFMPMKQK